jgi:hypothetical protein
VIRIAPKPIRWTVRSPPIVIVSITASLNGSAPRIQATTCRGEQVWAKTVRVVSGGPFISAVVSV